MAPPNNPEVCRVTMKFGRDTREELNTFHVWNPLGWNVDDLPVLAGVFRDWWNTSYKAQQHSNVCLNTVQCRVYDPADPLSYDLFVNPAICGGISTGEPAPASVTLAVSLRTNLAGRRYRGRFYAVGITDAATQPDDRASSSFVTSVGVAGAALITAVLNAGWGLVVFHRDNNTFTNYVTCVVENILDSQRRRLPGRGR